MIIIEDILMKNLMVVRFVKDCIIGNIYWRDIWIKNIPYFSKLRHLFSKMLNHECIKYKISFIKKNEIFREWLM